MTAHTVWDTYPALAAQARRRQAIGQEYGGCQEGTAGGGARSGWIPGRASERTWKGRSRPPLRPVRGRDELSGAHWVQVRLAARGRSLYTIWSL